MLYLRKHVETGSYFSGIGMDTDHLVEFWPLFPRCVPLATNVMKIGMLGAQNGETPFSCEQEVFCKEWIIQKVSSQEWPKCFFVLRTLGTNNKQHWHMFASFAKSLSFQSRMTAGMFVGTTGSLILR